MRNPDLAEELTQETFIKAWKGLDRYEPRNIPLQHWIIRIARNAVVDYWRDRRHFAFPIDGERDVQSEEGGFEDRMVLNFEIGELKRALSSLPQHQRDVLILRFFEKYSHAEVAATLGKSIISVRQIQVRALRNLNKLLSPLDI